MPRPATSRILSIALGTAASSALGMIPLHRLPLSVRTGYVVLPAVMVAGTALLALQRGAPRSDDATTPGSTTPGISGADGATQSAGTLNTATHDVSEQEVTKHSTQQDTEHEPTQNTEHELAPDTEHDDRGREQSGAWGLRAPTGREAAFAAAAGGLVAGAGAASIGLDRAIEGLLRRRGVAAPRVWMGIASGALTLVITVLDERAPTPDGAEGDSLEVQVRALLDEADPMALAPGQDDGTPADEYQVEAETIAAILRTDGRLTVTRLDEVWEEWFDERLTVLLGQERSAALSAALSGLVAPSRRAAV